MVDPLKLFISFFGGVSLVLSDSANVAISNPLTVWAVPGLERIDRTQQPVDTSTGIELYAARGEYESFQIGVRASQDTLTNVKVTVSDLVSVDGNILKNTNIELYREHYVYVNAPSFDHGSTNAPLGKGWYADGLIPIAVDVTTSTAAPSFPSNNTVTGPTVNEGQLHTDLVTVESNQNQPFWVDIFVPQAAAAGQYSGTFTVTSDQGTSVGEIVLNVWDFQLPVTPSLNSAFLYYGAQTQQASEELLRHRVNPQFQQNPQANLQRELIDKFGLQSVNLGFWSGAESGNCQMTAPPALTDIQAAIAYHEPDLRKYVYSADEIGECPNLYESVKEWGRALHAAAVDNLVVIPPVPELLDDGSGTGRSAIDIWVILPKDYAAAASHVATALAKGDQVWSYNALVQDGYSPKWQIDFTPINLRIQPGFISQSLGLTGLLYWRVDAWSQDPWNDVSTFVDNNGRTYAGDGMLVYPGESVGLNGILPSMRLKWLRDGIEDYEYIEILKQLGESDKAFELSRSVGASWRNWSKDPTLLESVRRQLGTEIERLTLDQSRSKDRSTKANLSSSVLLRREI